MRGEVCEWLAEEGAAAGVGMSCCCTLASLVAPGVTARFLSVAQQLTTRSHLPPAMLAQKETFLISLLQGIFKSCSFVFQPSKEEANEKKTEDNLTTLFPGQKRRISYLVKQGNVSADLEADV